jgi:hypothetical protein
MSATNGSTFRTARRLVGICLAVVFALAAFATTASAKGVTKTYLAIGDSLAFGYSQQLYNEHSAESDPASFFENGYVDDYFNHIAGKSQWSKVDLGCPGETTKSLIGNGPIGKALEAEFGATTEAPCAYQEAFNAFKKPGLGGPLHVPYVGKSQLEAALEQIAIHSKEGLNKPIAKITINIGANDELAQVHACEKEVGEEFGKEGKSKYGGTPEEAVKHCLEAHVPSLVETIIRNTEAVGFALRHAKSFGALENYEGPITFVASYDPFGAVFVAGKELLTGSVPLAGLINANEAAKFGQKFNPEKSEFGFEACTANPLPYFNPKNKNEPTRLQTLTNMANGTEFEGKKNGPDIHPTPLGYEKLARIAKHACG